MDLPNKGTPDAVGGAASVRINNNNSRLPNIAKPTKKTHKRAYIFKEMLGVYVGMYIFLGGKNLLW